MHGTSINKVKIFAESLDKKRKMKILDVGGVDPDASYRQLFQNHNAVYETMNIKFEFGYCPKSDITVNHPYDWKEIKDSSYDVILCGQVFEHAEFFWITLLEMRRILKKGGFCLITAPSHWHEHRAPFDCYRFYADGLYAMAKFINLKPHYAYAEHPKWVDRNLCDAIIVMEKIESENDPKFKKLHQSMMSLTFDNYYEVGRNIKFLTSSSSSWENKKNMKWRSLEGQYCDGLLSANYFFHTANSDNPFIVFDLNRTCQIDTIKIFNREKHEDRNKDITVYHSTDMLSWEKVYESNELWGGIYDLSPLIIKCNLFTRFIRIEKRLSGILHFDQIQFFFGKMP